MTTLKIEATRDWTQFSTLKKCLIQLEIYQRLSFREKAIFLDSFELDSLNMNQTRSFELETESQVRYFGQKHLIKFFIELARRIIQALNGQTLEITNYQSVDDGSAFFFNSDEVRAIGLNAHFIFSPQMQSPDAPCSNALSKRLYNLIDHKFIKMNKSEIPVFERAARFALRNNNPWAACKIWEAIIHSHLTHEGLQFLALSKTMLEQPDSALELYSQALLLAPINKPGVTVRILYFQAMVYLRMKQRNEQANGITESIIENAKSMIGKLALNEPSDLLSYLMLKNGEALLHFYQNKINSALGIMEEIESLCRDGLKRARNEDLEKYLTVIKYNKAQTLVACERLQEAHKIFSEIILEDDQLIEYKLEYIRINVRLGFFDDAKLQIKNVLQLAPFSPEAHCILGYIHYSDKKYPEAITSYLQACQYTGFKIFEPVYQLTSIYNELGRYSEALALINKYGGSIERANHYEDWQSIMCETLINLGYQEESLNILRKANELFPESQIITNNLNLLSKYETA